MLLQQDITFGLFFGLALLGRVEGIGQSCRNCNCKNWDGATYSECRPITDSEPCTEFCVFCEEDGVTPLPGSIDQQRQTCSVCSGHRCGRFFNDCKCQSASLPYCREGDGQCGDADQYRLAESSSKYDYDGDTETFRFCPERFSGQYCGKSASEDCDGVRCTQLYHPANGVRWVRSLEACATKCAQTTNCAYYSYTEGDHDCLLFDKCPAARDYVGDQDPKPTTTRPLYCNDACEVQEGTRFWGGHNDELAGMTMIWVTSVEQCSAQCWKNQSCKYFVYEAENKTCWLLAEKGKVDADDRFTSGSRCDNEPNLVDCGGHSASICADCPHVIDGKWRSTPNPDYCAGECEMEGKSCVYRPDTPQGKPQWMSGSRIRRSCCSYHSRYGVIPFHSWGSTPEAEKWWYEVHGCDTVLQDEGALLANCGLVSLPTRQGVSRESNVKNCRCSNEYDESYCNNWSQKTTDEHLGGWCYLAGGLHSSNCPGAVKDGDRYLTYDDKICNNAWVARNGFPLCNGPNVERTSATCCDGLVENIEERPLADPKYCTESNPEHGKTCWSTKIMCRPDYCKKEMNAFYHGKLINMGGSDGAYKGHLRDAETCRQACQETSGCKGWTFHKHRLSTQDNCYLKSSIQLELRELDNGCCDSGMMCAVKSFDCLDLQMPSSDEIISNYCSPGMIDMLWSDQQSTEGIPIEMSLTRSSTHTTTRSTQTGFTQEHGWNLEHMDESMHETSKTTTVTTKDPSTSEGHSFGIEGLISAGHSESNSCVNTNTKWCKIKHSGWIGAVVGFFSHKPDKKCQCKEVTTSNTETFSDTHQTTVGVMQSQSQSYENGFSEATETYEAETATWTCPEFNNCFYSEYVLTAMCSIPYWGTCTTVFEEKDTNGRNIVRNVEIKKNDKNKFLVTKSSKEKISYVRSSGKMTDGNSCGVQITPAVDNSDTVRLHPWVACPEPKDVHDLPNCDCMLPRFKDCRTATHLDNVLSQGDKCQLANRPLIADYDDKGACLESQPNWIEIGNCFGVDVYIVSGYNKEVYDGLYKGIRGLSETPDFGYDFDMAWSSSFLATEDNGHMLAPL